MTLKKTVESLAQNAVSTATTAVRHPLGTAARATDLVKETAGAGIGLVRNRIGGAPAQAPSPDREKLGTQSKAETAGEPDKETGAAAKDTAQEVVGKVEDAASVAKDAPAAKKTPAAKKSPAAKKAPVAKKSPAAKKSTPAKATAEKDAAEDPRDHIPGPDLAPYVPPLPDELPEPIVIVADDASTS